jgi:hypothetical protein
MTSPLLLSRPEIDDERWNTFITNAAQSVVYGYSWYLDVVCEDWKALIWPSPDDYQIVIPLPLKRKWGMAVVEQPLFCQYLGFFSVTEITPAQRDVFLGKLSYSFAYISTYSFNPGNTPMLDPGMLESFQFIGRKNQTHWLSLAQPMPQIQANYSSDRKLNLKRAEKSDWLVEERSDITPLIQLFKRHHAGQMQGGVRPKTYRMLAVLFEVLSEKHAATIYYASGNNEVHAGALFVQAGKTGIYLFNAADQTGRNGNARTFLLNKYFEAQAGKLENFDFETPEKLSVSSFYKSFGAAGIPYFSIRKNELYFPFKQIQNWRLRKILNTTAAPSADSSLI